MKEDMKSIGYDGLILLFADGHQMTKSFFDSVAEIAKRYGFGESKVKMMLKRTRDKLLIYLEKEGFFV
jgi:hypothetical protein